MQQLSVPPGDKWTAAIILTCNRKQKFLPSFYKARNCQAAAIMTNCSKEKEELYYKGKNFQRSITPHHKFNKTEYSCNRMSTKVYIAHVDVFLC